MDGGIEPADEETVLRVRERAARAVQAVFEAFDFPPITDAEVEAATVGYDSADLPDRDRASDVAAAAGCSWSRSPARTLPALADDGFSDVAEAVFAMQRQRVSGDYLQTSAVIEPDGEVRSAVSDPNLYAGPGTGWALDGDRWERLQALPHVLDPRSLASPATDRPPLLVDTRDAEPGSRPDEVVIAVGPAFGDGLRQTINDLLHEAVLGALVEGVREGGASPRLVRVRRSSDVAFIGHDGALLAGSGVAVGLQSRGRPSSTGPTCSRSTTSSCSACRRSTRSTPTGRSGATPPATRSGAPWVPTALDNFARAKLIVRRP